MSAASRLAIHAVGYMVDPTLDRLVTCATMADDLGVSQDHLGKVLLVLSREGILVAKRGRGGGFSLNPEARDRTMMSVVQLFDGDLATGDCQLEVDTCQVGDCFLGAVEREISERLAECLSGTTIGGLAPELPHSPGDGHDHGH